MTQQKPQEEQKKHFWSLSLHWCRTFGLGLAFGEPVCITHDYPDGRYCMTLPGKLYVGPLLINFSFPVGRSHRLPF